jgi:hypothetical protein
MTMILRLREGYNGPIKATVAAPPHNTLYDVGAALHEGGGEIRTENHPLGLLLSRMRRDKGELFDTFHVNAAGEEVQLERRRVNPVSVPAMPGAPTEIEAQHQTGSEYATLHKAELIEIAQERGLTVSDAQTKAELVATLEQSDEEGTGNDS